MTKEMHEKTSFQRVLVKEVKNISITLYIVQYNSRTVCDLSYVKDQYLAIYV